ncbi:MAG TPA: PIN domain-containing protein [Longimicrobiales bacterium]|nr:PIN domain-containing protein [Longimicrobiales bacterium]
MHRLFLDANVLFSAAYRADAGVARLWELPDAELVTSDYAVEEARRNLHEPHQLTRLDTLLGGVRVVAARHPDAGLRRGIELADKDWPILGGAVSAGATHLITGDVRDFGRYFGETVLGVVILPPAVYLRSTP